jgi:hypothetical protein
MNGCHVEQRQVLGIGTSGHGVDDALTIFVTIEIVHTRFKEGHMAAIHGLGA